MKNINSNKLMSRFDHSEFAVSLDGKSIKELEEILKESIEEGIQIYRNSYCEYPEKIRTYLDRYKCDGYRIGNQITCCLNYLTIIEKNESKRMLYSKLLETCVRAPRFYVTNVEIEYKEFLTMKLNMMQKYAEVLKSEDYDLIKKFKKGMDESENFELMQIVDMLNHRVTEQYNFTIQMKISLRNHENGGGGVEYL